MSLAVEHPLFLSMVILSTLAACATEPEIAAIDTVDRRIFASQGIDPIIGGQVELADELAASSPTHRVHTRRLSPEVASGAEAPLRMPHRVLPEIVAWGSDLPEAEPLPAFEQVAAEDVSLPGLIRLTLNHNGEIARAAETVSGADIAAINAVFAYMPRLSAFGEYSRVFQEVIDSDNEVFQKGSADFPVLNLQAELRQPVIDFARLFSIRRADTGRSVARATYLGVVQAVIFEVVNTYVNALDNKLRLASVEARMALLRDQIVAEERLLELGRSVPAARQLLEIELGSAALERTEYAENMVIALGELSRLTGRAVRDVADFDLPPEVWEHAGEGPLEPYLVAALRDNPLVKQRRIETLERRQLYQESLLGDFSPSLEAFARQEYEDRDASRFGGGSRTLDHTIGLQLTVPLFNARGEGYRSREQLSGLRQSVIAEAQLRRELEGEIPSLLNRLATQRESMRQAEAAVAAAGQLVEAAKAGVRAGVSPKFAVNMQELQLERAREWATRTRFTFVRSWVRLAYLTGSDAFIRIKGDPVLVAGGEPVPGWLGEPEQQDLAIADATPPVHQAAAEAVQVEPAAGPAAGPDASPADLPAPLVLSDAQAAAFIVEP